MCTVSWVHEEDGYQLLCNRDEKLTRMPAGAPRIHTAGGARFIAPVDGDFGGTWICTNEFGLSLCLLNGANLSGEPASKNPALRQRRSRGLLLPDLAGAASAREVCERLSRLDLRPFAPFTLVALEPGQPAAVVEWDGAGKSVVPHGDPYMPLVSSSFDFEGVRLKRLDLFRRRANGQCPDAKALFAFHESHGAGADAYSPCMHRADAQTVSFSWVKVTDSQAEFFYSPGSLCQWKHGQSVTLPLVQ
jgi:Transport and Golgi organisation 2